jgi:hypothetical protein
VRCLMLDITLHPLLQIDGVKWGYHGRWSMPYVLLLTCIWQSLSFKLLLGSVLLCSFLFPLGWGFLFFMPADAHWFLASEMLITLL